MGLQLCLCFNGGLAEDRQTISDAGSLKQFKLSFWSFGIGSTTNSQSFSCFSAPRFRGFSCNSF